MKKILKLVFLSMLILLFLGGCDVLVVSPPAGPGPSTGTGIVNPPVSSGLVTILITSSDGVHGSVYIDGAYVGDLQPNDTLSVYNISTGTHTLTLNTLPYTTYTINVQYDNQIINIDWYGNAW